MTYFGTDRLLHQLLSMSRFHKRLLSVSADLCFLTVSLWLAFALRLESFTWLPDRHQVVAGGCTVLFTVYAFVRLGLYRAIIRYITERALLAVLSGVLISAVTLIVTGYLLQAFIPRSVPVLYAGLSFLMVAGSRFLVRSLISKPVNRSRQAVVIMGAGTKGVQLLSALKQGSDFCPVAFVSTKAENHRSLIAGLPVYGLGHVESAIRQHGAGRVLLALEDSVSIDRNALIRTLEPLSVAVQTVPSMSEVVSGKARIQDLRDLTLEDLLGRDPVCPDDAIVAESLKQKVVMVTGAGGSIGSELCRQIIRCRPSNLVIYDSSEFALYAIERELRTINDVESLAVNINALLGSVTNRKRCASTIRAFGVQTIYHAAAYKHVPVVEQNVIEGVQNNVFGTWHCAEAAIECGVERFVLISTDKAVRPTNVMGASKRLAELVLQALASRQQKTVFSMVRFGNVLGSSGSVVPLFREQIRNGGPVTVTHPDICRYFMTIPEASQLVLQAGGMGGGGEVFVLDMGDPVQIVDLARKMIHLMGLRERTGTKPDNDIEIVFTGLRPGEKLYEELLVGDDPRPTRHPRIMMARESMMAWDSIKLLLDKLTVAIHQYDCRQVLRILVEDSITEFTPVNNMCDLVWCNGLDSTQPGVPVNDEEQRIQRLPL